MKDENISPEMEAFVSAIESFYIQLKYISGIPKKDKKFIKSLSKDIRKGKLTHGDTEDL